jgi:ribosomal protein S12 methylthiotransferase accessory factor
MRRQEMTTPWYASPYTGLFRRCGAIPRRAHDPAVSIWAGTLPRWDRDGADLATGGAGWDEASAEAAGVGEAIERRQCRPLPQDRLVTSSFDGWRMDEPAIEPERWVLFHPEQYARTAFPFPPFTRQSVLRWVCCRHAGSGRPWWVPEELVFLQPPVDGEHHLGPAISTGLSCGRAGDPVLLRGLQEVIERDALMGAWWGRYGLEEHDLARVLAVFPPSLPERLQRPNLRYRCYRVASPFSAHVTVVTLEGEDHEGFCFSVGSACRETRSASWQKAFLEAVQGRHFVRYLKARGEDHAEGGMPVDFAGHALFYSLHPKQLPTTVLNRADAVSSASEEQIIEKGEALVERLGPGRPVLFRQVIPPALMAAELDWVVLRVLVPGLQPMHGHHGYPFLGGPLWTPRGIAEWRSILPHPFP